MEELKRMEKPERTKTFPAMEKELELRAQEALTEDDDESGEIEETN
jgi:hypothetical protein